MGLMMKNEKISDRSRLVVEKINVKVLKKGHFKSNFYPE
jgi:hypothetical protein